MRVVFRFGVYIVTESVMGLWWFRWIVFSLSCIGLVTSLTSSKSYCINYFIFVPNCAVVIFANITCIKLPLNPFYLHQIQHMNTGTKCQHMRQLAVLQLLFWETRKIVGTWFEIILSAMWIAKPWGTFVVFCWSVSYADYFLMFVFSRDFLFCPAWHRLFSCCRFPPRFCAHFLLFSIGLICFMAIQNISNPGIVFTLGFILTRQNLHGQSN